VLGGASILTWQTLIDFIEHNHLGDVASTLGLFITVGGFGATIIGVYKSKGAAQRAELAAKSTRDSIRLMQTAVDFAAAISILEEIKRLHRAAQWSVVPDRYAALRKILITLRTANARLNGHQLSAIQNAVANLSQLESAVERREDNPSGLKPAKFNLVISKDIDELVAALEELKASDIGASQ